MDSTDNCVLSLYKKYSLSFLLKSDRLYLLYQKPSICKIYGARIAVRIPLRISPRLA